MAAGNFNHFCNKIDIKRFTIQNSLYMIMIFVIISLLENLERRKDKRSMKKRHIALMMTVLMLAVSGCATKDPASKKIENEHISISQYDAIEIDKIEKPAEPSDKEIDEQLDMIIQQHASWEDITDRSIEMGDFVTIDFTGKMKGKEFDGGSAEDYQIEVGSGMMIDGFEESLLDHKKDDKFTWKGKFPENYGHEDLNGKAVEFDITVKAIKKQILPEINDKFVQSVSESSKTVEDYRKELKEMLQADRDAQYESEVVGAAWNAVVEKSNVKKFPEGRVDELTKTLITNYKEQAKTYDMKYEEFLEQYMQSTVEEFEAQAAESAEFLATQELIVDAIMEAENLKLSDKEFKDHAKLVAEQYGYESIEELIKEAGEDDLKFTAKLEKVKAWIGERCKQVEPEKDDDEFVMDPEYTMDDDQDDGATADKENGTTTDKEKTEKKETK